MSHGFTWMLVHIGNCACKRTDIQHSWLILLSKVAHQMWCNHLFSHRNKTTERVVGLWVGGNREGGVGQNLKKWGRGRQYRGDYRLYYFSLHDGCHFTLSNLLM